MSKYSLVFLIVIAIYAVINPANGLEKDWTYKLVQINWNTSNPDIFKTPLRTIRVAPGVYGINGSILIGVDVDDGYKIQGRVAISTSGSSQYTRTPFSVPPTRLTKLMNIHYKNFFMKDVKDCSTLPQFEGEWKPPFKKGEYVMNSCVMSTDKLPTHMLPGMYKLVIIFTGPSFVAVLEFIAQINAKFM